MKLQFLFSHKNDDAQSSKSRIEAVVRRCSVKKVFLEISQNSQESTCDRVSYLIKFQACNFIKKETLAQAFSCEFCEIFKNTFLHIAPLVAASARNTKSGILEKRNLVSLALPHKFLDCTNPSHFL